MESTIYLVIVTTPDSVDIIYNGRIGRVARKKCHDRISELMEQCGYDYLEELEDEGITVEVKEIDTGDCNLNVWTA